MLPTIVLRLILLIRLLKGEKYAPVFTLLDDVFAAKRMMLATTAFVASVCVVLFATLLHYTEKNNSALVDHVRMSERYESVPSALWYTMINLTYVRKHEGLLGESLLTSMLQR